MIFTKHAKEYNTFIFSFINYISQITGQVSVRDKRHYVLHFAVTRIVFRHQ